MSAMRLLRAFGIALWRTLRGDLPPPDAFETWLQTARDQLAELERLIAGEAVAPETLRLRIDRREMSLQLILAALRFHLDEEFPQLRRRFGDECLTVLRATCLDDSFRLQKLAALPQLSPALQECLQALAQHLLQLPEAGAR